MIIYQTSQNDREVARDGHQDTIGLLRQLTPVAAQLKQQALWDPISSEQILLISSQAPLAALPPQPSTFFQE
jgi:hypothetical protein